MSAPEAITRREVRGSARLWMGILVGPLAWAVQLGVDWFLAEVVACAPSSGAVGTVGGVPLLVVTGLINVSLLAVTVASGWLARGCLASIRRRGDDSSGHRAEWMARSGILISVAFGVVITASFPVMVLTDFGCGQ